MELISIIVPVFNEQEHIADCLESLLSLDYPVHQREIIVVDNNSTDGSAEIIKSYPVRYVFTARPGAAAARNKGAEVARGDILAFVDADCLPEENWLQEICQPLITEQADIAQPLRDGLNINLWAQFRQKQHQSFIARLKHEADNVGLTTTECMAIRKGAFVNLGGFNEAFLRCEDTEFSVRFHRQGYRAVFVPSARIRHINPTDLSEILHVREREGFFNFKVIKMCSREEREKFFPECRRWYYRVLTGQQLVDWFILNLFLGISYAVIGLFTFLLELLRSVGLGKPLYPLFAFTVDLSFLRGKCLAKLSEISCLLHSEHCLRNIKSSW